MASYGICQHRLTSHLAASRGCQSCRRFESWQGSSMRMEIESELVPLECSSGCVTTRPRRLPPRCSRWVQFANQPPFFAGFSSTARFSVASTERTAFCFNVSLRFCISNFPILLPSVPLFP
eukprot:3106373-Rhodomonas_salina.1